jgi:RNA polymerase sigma-70 factor (ECF subfamily)
MNEDWDNWILGKATRLVLYARQYVGNLHDAEDVVEDAICRFWPRRLSVAQRDAYLFACVRHAAIDYLKLARRRQARETHDAAGRPESFFETTPDSHQLAQRVEAALARLSLQEREVLVLKIWGGMTLEQVAEAADLPRGTVFSRYRNALAKLRELLRSEADT